MYELRMVYLSPHPPVIEAIQVNTVHETHIGSADSLAYWIQEWGLPVGANASSAVPGGFNAVTAREMLETRTTNNPTSGLFSIHQCTSFTAKLMPVIGWPFISMNVTWRDSAAAQPAGGDYIRLLRATPTGNTYGFTPLSHYSPVLRGLALLDAQTCTPVGRTPMYDD
ncbi:hypothetical protein PGT21_007007 [Puccinia graminis f. sp. tritici]|uniref:Uncharacterized protein n=1 Tax=Puccinia graminis f. sp. tritici TaxID=56615 RepID=A0A5B0LM20_PUCGR|nr:hypothetical protein PGT21_007007 [Puccinia graminis f. sp. tritici]